MSTRSTTHFMQGDRLVAIVYRHPDGYPEGRGRDLQRFFDDVEAQTQDTRFGDASYLAAKLVVWLAREFATSLVRDSKGEYAWLPHFETRPLDFISVGVVMEDPGDIEYRYVVQCSSEWPSPRPKVTCWDVHEEREVEIPAAEEVPS